MFTPTSASRADSSSEGVPGPGAVDGVEEVCPCSVLRDKRWLRRCGGPVEKVPSLAAPILMQHKLVHLIIDPEVSAGIGKGSWNMGEEELGNQSASSLHWASVLPPLRINKGGGHRRF